MAKSTKRSSQVAHTDGGRVRNLDTPVWLNDGQTISYMGHPVRGADPKTFEVLLGCYARDADSVFFHCRRSQKIDRRTFRVLNAHFGVDAVHAYFITTPIRHADPKSFRVLDSSLVYNGETGAAGTFLIAGYGADAKRVWFCSGKGIYQLKSADPQSFVSLGNRFGYDRQQVFFERAALHGVDRMTWRPWSSLLSLDKDSVFFTNKRVAGVDRPSVRLLMGSNCFMDRHRVYSGATPITTEEYLGRLKYRQEGCARERRRMLNGEVFDLVLNEWPQAV